MYPAEGGFSIAERGCLNRANMAVVFMWLKHYQTTRLPRLMVTKAPPFHSVGKVNPN